MRILVVGSDANAYSIAKKMSELENVDLVFVAPGNKYIKDFATSIDIADDNVDELLDFAKANEINLTVVASEAPIANSIANIFSSEGLNIFAPSVNSARIALSKSSAKKFMYKLHIQTPRFGIFDKEGMAIDYARKIKYPVVIKNDSHDPINKTVICNTFSKAKYAIEKFFENFNKKIVIEDFVNAHEFSLYLITDGFTAFQLGTVAKNNEDNQDLVKSTTNFIYSPDYSVSEELQSKIMKRIVCPVLDEIAKNSQPYVGILGIDFLVSKNNFQVTEFNTFFSPMHLQAILPLLQDNLYDLFLAAANGSLSDDYTRLSLLDSYSYSIEYELDNPVTEKEEGIEIAYTQSDKPILTAIGATLNSAKNNLNDYIDSLNANVATVEKNDSGEADE